MSAAQSSCKWLTQRGLSGYVFPNKLHEVMLCPRGEEGSFDGMVEIHRSFELELLKPERESKAKTGAFIRVETLMTPPKNPAKGYWAFVRSAPRSP